MCAHYLALQLYELIPITLKNICNKNTNIIFLCLFILFTLYIYYIHILKEIPGVNVICY